MSASEDFMIFMKGTLTTCGAFMISMAQAMEPSAAVWFMAIGGGLVGTAIREDQSWRRILGHTLLSVLVGIAGSNLMDYYYHVPKPSSALFFSVFASPMTMYFNKKILVEGPWSIIPFWRRQP